MFKQNCTFRLSLVLLLFTVLSVAPEGASGQAISGQEAIEEIFSKYHQYEGFQGAVLVAEKGKIVYKNAFGLANREWNILNQVDSRFNIASVSKQFAAMLAMQLYEEGKIHLDSTISSYYPEYRSDVAQQVSIHHLLTHRSGIPNYTSIPYVWSDSLRNSYSSQELIEKFCSGDLEFRPGSRYSYSNSGYFILSVILEKVSGKPFEKLLEERILQPLNMQNTGVDKRSLVIDKRSYGYEMRNDTFSNARPMYMANLQGAGNMYSTVEDLYRWDRALHERKLISAEGHQKMITAFSEVSDTWITPYKSSYGFGMGIATVRGPQNRELDMVFHSGHITGYSSFVARFVDDEHLVVILSNMGDVSTIRMNEIAQQVKNVLYGLPYEVSGRSMRSTLMKTIQENGIAAAIRQYEQLTQAFPYEYRDTERELHALGLDLASGNMHDTALEIFKLNARVNPNWKTYMTLADAHYSQQGFEEAAFFYKKSIENNPRRTAGEVGGFNAAKKSLTSLNQ